MIAKELYRLKKEKESLEEELRAGSPDTVEPLRELLRKKTAEYEKIKKMLDGAKEPPEYRKAH